MFDILDKYLEDKERIKKGPNSFEMLRNKLKAKKLEHKNCKLEILEKSKKLMENSEKLSNIARGVIKERNMLKEFLNIQISISKFIK